MILRKPMDHLYLRTAFIVTQALICPILTTQFLVIRPNYMAAPKSAPAVFSVQHLRITQHLLQGRHQVQIMSGPHFRKDHIILV